VLILLGVFFLLGNMHVIPWSRLGLYFARFWPVLLILGGLIKLIEHFVAEHQGRRAARIGAGSVFLVILLIVAGLIASGARRVRWNELDDDWHLQGGIFDGIIGQQYSFRQQLQQDFPAGTVLRVTSDRGNVTVHSWNENRIQVLVNKRLRAESQEDADNADNATRAQLTITGTDCLLNANTHGAGERPVESDLDITIPANAVLDVATRRGDVDVKDRSGNVTVSNSGGGVTLENIKGDAILRIRRGDIRIARVTGDVNVDGEANSINVSNVASVRMNGGATNGLSLSKIEKSVEYQSSRTSLKFVRLDGDLTLQGSDLNGNDMTGPLHLATRSKDIHLNGVTGPVDVENTNGEIEVHVNKLPLNGVQIRNRKGDIRLVLPARSGFQIEARTRHGDISTDYNLNQHNQHGEGSLNGTVGGGGPKIEIDNDFGDIGVKKAG
jgi:DUF4097 and DUF4098 domain-containing protein YvlB